MRILGIDTSSVETNMVLTDGGEVIAAAREKPFKTHSKKLLSTLRGIITERGVSLSSINALAVSRGPGSFTGVRIGLGTAMGLGDALNIPVIGAGTLDALARVAPPWDGGYICPVLNARKGEVYAALYSMEGRSLKKLTGDLALSPESLADMIDRPTLFIGDGFAPYAETLRALIPFEVEVIDSPGRPVAEGVAAIAREEALAGRTADNPPEPSYIRRSQAEINWEKLHTNTAEGGGR